MRVLKGFMLTLLVIATVYGCAPTVRQEGVLDLGSAPAASTKQKSNITSNIAKQRAAIAQNPGNWLPFANLSFWLNANGQYDEAVTAAKRAIELNSSAEAGFRNLGRAYQGKKQNDDALKAYKKAIAIAPLSETYRNLGILYWDRNDYAKAVRSFKKASELNAKNDGGLIYLAIAYYRTGEYDNAIAAIDRAIDLKNFGTLGMRLKSEISFDLITLRAMTVVSVDKGGPADKAGIKPGDGFGISEIKTHKPSVSHNDIRKYIEGNSPGTPVEVWTYREGFFAFPKTKTIILGRAKDPTHALKLGIKAAISARTGNSADALKYANESLDSEQSNKGSESWAKVAIGRIHIGNGNYGEAIKLLSGVAKSSATARILEATAHAKQGNTKKAVDIYAAIPKGKFSPKHVPLWSDRTALLEELKSFVASKRENADRLTAQGRYREALAALGDALKIADDAECREVYKVMAEILRAEPQLAALPEEARKYTLRGSVLTEEGNFEDAAQQYRRAVQAAPYIAKLHFNVAMVYGEARNYPESIRHMKIYLQLAPEAPNARAVKDQIYKWEFKMEKGR